MCYEENIEEDSTQTCFEETGQEIYLQLEAVGPKSVATLRCGMVSEQVQRQSGNIPVQVAKDEEPEPESGWALIAPVFFSLFDRPF